MVRIAWLVVVATFLSVHVSATEEIDASVPRGGNCTYSELSCVAGTTCAGTDTNKRCVKPMPLNGRCSVDPFWVCEENLECDANVCKLLRRSSCLGAESSCVSGTVCAGTDTKKRCVKPMPICGKCAVDPFWVCRDGLVCESNVCKVPRGQSCTSSRNCCVSGTVCTGTRGKMRCVKPMPVCAKCGVDPYWVCQDGIICESNVCKVPRRGDCTQPGSCCESNTVCAGTETKKRCVKPMPLEGQCGVNPYRVCADGLICESNVCVSPGQ